MSTASAPAPTSPTTSGTYVPEPCVVRSIQKQTEHENLYELAFEHGRDLGHRPGQFVQVSIMGVGECPISICTSPTRPGSFGLCVRRVGEVTNHIHRLEEGDIVGVRGPLGCGFPVEELHGKDMIVVAGGLGLAPARSLIEYVLDQRARFGGFSLFYGARRPAELLFRDDLSRWRESPDVDFHMTVDQPDEQWRGKTGVVTTLFKGLPRLSPKDTAVVIIGPPVMFKFVVIEFLARGITQDAILCSLERRMKCGVGKCGHCQANNVYVCREGPVFRYGRLKAIREAFA